MAEMPASDGPAAAPQPSAQAGATPEGGAAADDGARTSAQSLDRARSRLEMALSRLEQATIAMLARKSAMEVDRRGLGDTARQLQHERDEMRGFILDGAEILDGLIARMAGAMAEPGEGEEEDKADAAETAAGGLDRDTAGSGYDGSGHGHHQRQGLPHRLQSR